MNDAKRAARWGLGSAAAVGLLVFVVRRLRARGRWRWMVGTGLLHLLRDRASEIAATLSIRPEQANPLLSSAGSAPLTQSVKVHELARRQGMDLRSLLLAAGADEAIAPEAMMTVEMEIKYEGYFARERVQASKLGRMGQFLLSAELPYAGFRSLSIEARQKLDARRPRTLAQAASIPGVGPNDLQNLVLEVERHRRATQADAAIS